jgi:hypothetical protein
VPSDALALLLAFGALLWLSVGSLASVVGRRLQELEGKVDMVTTNGLLSVTDAESDDRQARPTGDR